jgi:hypothetical protein
MSLPTLIATTTSSTTGPSHKSHDLSSSPKRFVSTNNNNNSLKRSLSSSVAAAETLMGIRLNGPGNNNEIDSRVEDNTKISPRGSKSNAPTFDDNDNEKDTGAPEKKRKIKSISSKFQEGIQQQPNQEQKQDQDQTQQQQSKHSQQQQLQQQGQSEKRKASPCEIFVNMHMLISEDDLRKYCLFHGLSTTGNKTSLVIRVLIHREKKNNNTVPVISEILNLFVRNADIIMEEYDMMPKAGGFKAQVDQCFALQQNLPAGKGTPSSTNSSRSTTPLGFSPMSQYTPSFHSFGSPTPMSQLGSPFYPSQGFFGSPHLYPSSLLGPSTMGYDWSLLSPRSIEQFNLSKKLTASMHPGLQIPGGTTILENRNRSSQ